MSKIIEKALGMFGDGVPSKKDMLSDVWMPYRAKTNGDERKTLNAIFCYVNAYNDLKKGKVSSDYSTLMTINSDLELPNELDISLIKTMHDELKASQEAAQTALELSRSDLAKSNVDKATMILKKLKKDLGADNMHFCFDSSEWDDVLIIHDNTTDKSHKIYINEI